MVEVWLSQDEIDTLEMQARKLRNRLVIKLGAYSGLRISETVSIRVEDLQEEIIDGESRYFVTVEGKKTDQDAEGETEKKERDAWVTKDTWKDIRTYINQEGLRHADHILQSREGGSLHVDSARRIVRQIAQRAYEETGKEKFLDVSSHDLRRFFAQHLAEEKGVNLRVVMTRGGWEDMSTFVEHYLNKPSKRTTAQELAEVGWE